MIKKNDIITTEIIDYSSDGNGVARYENMVIFVVIIIDAIWKSK